MNERHPGSEADGACPECLRRSWLLSELSPLLDYHRGDAERLRELLELPDELLIDALGGSRRASLHAAHRGWTAHEESAGQVICPHDPGYPQRLRDGSPGVALHIEGTMAQLERLLDAPVVAILGSANPSDYGTRIASALARGLAASGVTVISKLESGIAHAAHRGVAQLGAGSLAVSADGLEAAREGPRSKLYEELMRGGCLLSELPRRAKGRGWGALAAERVLLGLASVVVLVEGGDPSRELRTAHLATKLGIPMCAVPGRLGNPLSEGPHSLILDGARLIRGARDVLELLYEGRAAETSSLPLPGSGLAAHLQTMLARVMAGKTPPTDCWTIRRGQARPSPRSASWRWPASFRGHPPAATSPPSRRCSDSCRPRRDKP